jgi:hypothetical protein
MPLDLLPVLLFIPSSAALEACIPEAQSSIFALYSPAQEPRKLRVLLDRVFWPLERRSGMQIGGGLCVEIQLMEPDFLSELLLFVIGAVMSFFVTLLRR